MDVAAAVFLADGRSEEGSVATGPCQVETSLLEKHGVVFFSAAAAAAEKRVEVEVGRSGDKGVVGSYFCGRDDRLGALRVTSLTDLL